MVEFQPHPIQQCDQADVFVEVEFDGLQSLGEGAVVRIAGDIGVDEEFGVRGSKLRAAGPTPFLFVLAGEDDQALERVSPNEYVDLTLDRTGRQLGAVPDPQPLEGGDVGQGVGGSVDFMADVGVVGVVPAEFFDEQGAEVVIVD